jgi:hypothetical protein
MQTTGGRDIDSGPIKPMAQVYNNGHSTEIAGRYIKPKKDFNFNIIHAL